MKILMLVLAIINGAITFVRELGRLVTSLKKTNRPPYFITLANENIKIKQTEELRLTMEQYQINMEKLFHKNQLHSRIKTEFTSSEINFRDKMNKNGIDQDFGFDLLVQMALHKRAHLPTLVGILRKHFKGNNQKTTDNILLACQIDLVDWSPNLKIFIVKYDISPNVQAEIDLYQYPLPMIVEPKELQSNTDTGYFTSKNSVILKNNHHNDDVCLDHLNKANKVKLILNNDVAAYIKNTWRNLDKPKTGESRKEYQRRVKAFEKYDANARDVMAHLEIAGGEFYLTHKYDKRGRVYCQGYHVNYQGNPWNKAVIEFSHKELIQ